LRFARGTAGFFAARHHKPLNDRPTALWRQNF
jgi:hypothetical protein